ncbi:MAG: pstS [Verrucomicrobia bacterium]|nr:pstS [Verrucomicrobiota bacterium]
MGMKSFGYDLMSRCYTFVRAWFAPQASRVTANLNQIVKKILLTLACSLAGFLTQSSSAAAIAVDADLPGFVPTAAPLTGNLTVGGDGLTPLVERLFTLYRAAHPGVTCTNVQIDDHGELAQLTDGNVLVVGSRVTPTDQEVDAYYAKAEDAPLVIPAGKCNYNVKTGALNALGIAVPQDNPITSLTRGQVDAIFSRSVHGEFPSSITVWGQLGVTGKLAQEPINTYGYSLGSTRTTAFSRQALHNGTLRRGQTAVSAKKLISTFIAADPNGIGYFDTSLPAPGIKVLPISDDSGGEAAAPTVANIQANKYLYYRGNYFFAKAATEDVPMNPLAKEFIRLVLSKEGQVAASEVGIVPLGAREAKALLLLIP